MIDQNVLTNWWGLAVRGILAVAFGIAIIAMPGISLAALIVAFGVYALVEGIVNVASAIRARPTQPRWWVLLLEGVASVAAGVLAFAWPGITAIVLVWVVAFWAIVTGALEIAEAVYLRKQIKGEFLLALSGLLSIVLGVILLQNPGAGALALVMWIGVYAIIFGALLIILGGRVLASTHRFGRPAHA
jgi:uncharacterized membrane protein HdeD (DUF308 family)